MRIVCDENLAITPLLRLVASEITALPGRAINARDLTHADALLVRSVTPVDAALLGDTPVRFVGTATAGTEHLNLTDLDELGIPVASAPGSNAQAVTEWVLAALASFNRLPALMSGARLGIVGMGHVGTTLARTLSGLGIPVCGYDPLVTRWPKEVERIGLEDVLKSPVVSLHAALHSNGPYPSHHLIKAEQWPDLGHEQLLLNAGRGGLVSRASLLALSDRGVELGLDTWPDEPGVDATILARAVIATPHIAGYSTLAKSRATDRLVLAMAEALGLEIPEAPPQIPVTLEPLNSTALSTAEVVSDWLRQHYAIARDDARTREAAGQGGDIAPAAFDALRRHYPMRDELNGRGVILSPGQQHLRPYAAALGLVPIEQGVFSP